MKYVIYSLIFLFIIIAAFHCGKYTQTTRYFTSGGNTSNGYVATVIQLNQISQLKRLNNELWQRVKKIQEAGNRVTSAESINFVYKRENITLNDTVHYSDSVLTIQWLYNDSILLLKGENVLSGVTLHSNFFSRSQVNYIRLNGSINRIEAINPNGERINYYQGGEGITINNVQSFEVRKKRKLTPFIGIGMGYGYTPFVGGYQPFVGVSIGYGFTLKKF